MIDEKSSADIVEDAFARLLQTQPPQGPSMLVLEQTLRAVHRAQTEPKRISLLERFRKMNKFIKYAIEATAAAILVIVIGLLILLSGGRNSSVWAQAVDALEQADSVHFEVFAIRDGKQVKDAELWYARGRGVRERSLSSDGKVSERVDNGTFQWVYQSDRKSAIKSKSTDPVSSVRKILGYENKMKDMKLQRLPEIDRTIDGVVCQAYERQPRYKGVRRIVWVEDAKRPRRSERQRFEDGKWSAYTWVTFTYDKPLPENIFQPDFGPGVAVIDTTKGSPLDLNGNLLSGEVLGLVLTVHEVYRLDNDAILVAWSVQPSEETAKKFGSISSSQKTPKHYGDAQMTSPKLLPSEKGHVQPLTIAQCSRHAVQTQWTVLIPKGGWTKPVNAVRMDFIVHARGELQRDLEKKGQKSWLRGFVLGDLPLPKEAVSVQKAYRRVYGQAAAMHQVSKRGQVLLTGKNRPLNEREKEQRARTGDVDVEKMSTTPMHAPDRITPDEFIENIEHNYHLLKRK